MSDSDEFQDVPREDIKSFACVYGAAIDAERDGDHVQSMFKAYGDVMKWYDEVVWPTREPDSEDVEVALQIARDYLGPTTQTEISVHVGDALPDVEDEELLTY